MFLAWLMMTERADIETILENEWYGVRHSGEIPEIALYSAFFYLTEDLEGPHLELTETRYRKLVEAAEMRYREIVLRDLNHANRQKQIYRGVKRSISNWYRYESFCRRQKLDSSRLRREAASALLAFLTEEIVDIERTGRETIINCSFDELNRFAGQLGLVLSSLPVVIEKICQNDRNSRRYVA